MSIIVICGASCASVISLPATVVTVPLVRASSAVLSISTARSSSCGASSAVAIAQHPATAMRARNMATTGSWAAATGSLSAVELALAAAAAAAGRRIEEMWRLCTRPGM